MTQSRTRELYDAMDAFERWLRSSSIYIGGSMDREEKSSPTGQWYCNGRMNDLFRAWLGGMSYQRVAERSDAEKCSAPMFVGGDEVPEDVHIMMRRDVAQLTDGAESRWGDDHHALARAAYEAGWDNAMMYVTQCGDSDE